MSNDLYMKSLIDVMNQQEDMEAIFCEDFHSAISVQPDFVLFDIGSLINDEVFTVIREFNERGIHSIVLMNGDSQTGFLKFIEAGTGSLLIKTEETQAKIVETLRLIQKGYYFLPPIVVNYLMVELSEQKVINKEVLTYQLHKNAIDLSRKEIEIADLLRLGYKNPKIASILGLAEGTVKIHISHIYAKIGAKRRKKVITMLNDLLKDNEQ
ncbi:helix-turn-helix transcriptional regulator [Virgibacillus profundi]|nr:LuxR C-terminal-related transcriptional regulator [Virgibacillus profundi]